MLLRRGGLGDTLLTAALLRAMRRAHPAAELHFAGSSDAGAVLAALGLADLARSSEALELWLPERARRHLAAYALTVGDEPARCDRALAPHRPPPGVPFGRSLARQAGFEPQWPADAWLRPATCWAAGGPLVLAPGSGGATKCWPRGNWLELARLLGPRAAPLAVLVGPAERERDDPRRWPWPAAVEFVVEPDALALAGRLAAAGGFVGNDSGPTHLAAGLGVPTVAVFGPTDPVVWAPVGPRVRTVVAAAGTWPAVGAVVAAVDASSAG